MLVVCVFSMNFPCSFHGYFNNIPCLRIHGPSTSHVATWYPTRHFFERGMCAWNSRYEHVARNETIIIITLHPPRKKKYISKGGISKDLNTTWPTPLIIAPFLFISLGVTHESFTSQPFQYEQPSRWWIGSSYPCHSGTQQWSGNQQDTGHILSRIPVSNTNQSIRINRKWICVYI